MSRTTVRMDVRAARRQIAVKLPEAGVETAAVAVAAATAGNATSTDGDRSVPCFRRRQNHELSGQEQAAVSAVSAASEVLAVSKP